MVVVVYLVRLTFNCALSTCHTGNLCVSTLNFNKSSSSRQNWTQQHLYWPAVEPVCRRQRRCCGCCWLCRSTVMTNCFSCATRRLAVCVCACSLVLPAVFVAVLQSHDKWFIWVSVSAHMNATIRKFFNLLLLLFWAPHAWHFINKQICRHIHSKFSAAAGKWSV